MNIRFASPLAKVLGTKNCTLKLDGRLTAEEVLAKLSREVALAKASGPLRPDRPAIPYLFMIIKNGRVLLKPHDPLDDHDEIEIIPPIMGG